MTAEQQKTIKDHQQSPPVDITGLATALGLTVFESDELPENISGRICLDGVNTYSITVNANETYRRRRFTVAHECAHYLLHREKIGDGITDDGMYRSDKMSTKDEFEANNLAADLIMPRNLVLKRYYAGANTYAKLADLFEVSVPAMKTRLRYLLYLP